MPLTAFVLGPKKRIDIAKDIQVLGKRILIVYA